VRIGDRVISAKETARAGTIVRIEPAPPPASDALPEDIPISPLYEDEHLVVIDKPAGLVVHPAPGHPGGTLVNALLWRYRRGSDEERHLEEEGAEGEPATDRRRPGIVHRLDRDTSGVMVVARTQLARDHFTKLFAKHEIDREYVAIALGAVPARATYDTLHGRHPRDRKKFTTQVARGKRAVTHVALTEDLRGASLISCRLETGRTHQIRVHLAEHGHPLLGDRVYGSPPRDPRLRAIGDALGRQALHAAVLGFTHPLSGAALRFTTPLPEDLERALDALRR
jgi:23S rRNA pseudouridine1911/1915/1917 synthase